MVNVITLISEANNRQVWNNNNINTSASLTIFSYCQAFLCLHFLQKTKTNQETKQNKKQSNAHQSDAFGCVVKIIVTTLLKKPTNSLHLKMIEYQRYICNYTSLYRLCRLKFAEELLIALLGHSRRAFHNLAILFY